MFANCKLRFTIRLTEISQPVLVIKCLKRLAYKTVNCKEKNDPKPWWTPLCPYFEWPASFEAVRF